MLSKYIFYYIKYRIHIYSISTLITRDCISGFDVMLSFRGFSVSYTGALKEKNVLPFILLMERHSQNRYTRPSSSLIGGDRKLRGIDLLEFLSVRCPVGSVVIK